MVSWWPGDGNATDIQDGNDGTLQGDATYAPGKIAQAFSLDGSGDYVSVGDVDLLSTYTVDAWIELNSLAGQIILRGGGGHVYDWFVIGDGRLQAEMSDGAAVVVYRTTNPVIVAGTWQHVALTYDAAAGTGANMVSYVNGSNVGSNVSATALADGGPTPNPTDPARIGDGIVGLMDEVDVFNRVLSTAEIAAIADADSAGKCMSIPVGGTTWFQSDGSSYATGSLVVLSGAVAAVVAVAAGGWYTRNGGWVTARNRRFHLRTPFRERPKRSLPIAMPAPAGIRSFHLLPARLRTLHLMCTADQVDPPSSSLGVGKRLSGDRGGCAV